MKKYLLLGAIVLALVLSACKAEPAALTVMPTIPSWSADAVIAQFEKGNNVKVNFLMSGDAGQRAETAPSFQGCGVADVLYGVDNTFLSRAAGRGDLRSLCFPFAGQIPDEFKLDPKTAPAVDYGDVCINYEKVYFQQITWPSPVL